MELILLLILGGIVLFKISGEKATHRANARQRERDEKVYAAAKNDWENRVTNKELEEELEYKLYHNDRTLWDEANGSVEYYFGTKPEQPELVTEYFKKILYLFNGDDNQRIALRLLMANRGYLLDLDASWGIKYDTSAKIQRLAGEKKSMCLHFFNAINKKLEERGIYEQRYLCNGVSGRYQIFRGNESIIPHYGALYWAPAVSPLNKRLAAERD